MSEHCGFPVGDCILANPLEHTVVETATAYCLGVLDIEANGYPKDRDVNTWHLEHLERQTALIDAVKRLLESKK